MTVLEQLLACPCTPEFLSVEDCRFGFEYIDLLHRIGYRQFKLSNQSLTPLMSDSEIAYQFKLGCSGKFGDELDGAWLDHAAFLELYKKVVRNPETLDRLAEASIWWDIHCTI